MPTAVATVMRCGRSCARSGRCGRAYVMAPAALWLPRRNDRARACAWTFRSWWDPLVSDGCRHLQLMRVEHAIRGVWLPWIYKFERKEGKVLYLNT
jgi:hypothetical protein